MTKPLKWDRHSILAELRRQHMTLAGIADQYSLSRSCVKHIWTRPHQKAEMAIADFLQEPVESLFPDRYPKSGNRILRQSHSQSPQKHKSLAA